MSLLPCSSIDLLIICQTCYLRGLSKLACFCGVFTECWGVGSQASKRPWKDNVLSFLRQIFQDWGSGVSCVLTRGWGRKKKKNAGAISERIQPGLNRRDAFVCSSLLLGEACLAWRLQAREETRPGLWLPGSLETYYPGQDSLEGQDLPPPISCANSHCSRLWSHSSCVLLLSFLTKEHQTLWFPLEMFT